MRKILADIKAIAAAGEPIPGTFQVPPEPVAVEALFAQAVREKWTVDQLTEQLGGTEEARQASLVALGYNRHQRRKYNVLRRRSK